MTLRVTAIKCRDFYSIDCTAYSRVEFLEDLEADITHLKSS